MTDPDTPTPAGEPVGFNTPVDDPHHYDFQNAEVPPDEGAPLPGTGAGPVVD